MSNICAGVGGLAPLRPSPVSETLGNQRVRPAAPVAQMMDGRDLQSTMDFVARAHQVKGVR